MIKIILSITLLLFFVFYSCTPVEEVYPEISSEFDREWIELENIKILDKSGNPTNFPKRSRASVVVIGDKVYIIGGSTGSSFLNDIWEFSYQDTTLRQMTDFNGVGRANAIAFESDGKVYYGTGQHGGGADDIAVDLWEFNPDIGSLGEWNLVEGVFFNANQKRKEAVSIKINGQSIILTGRNKDGWNTNVVSFDSASQLLEDKKSHWRSRCKW